MKVSFKPFTSIAQIKAKGEFIKKGKIIPVRICKVTPKCNRHLFVALSNQWAFPTKSGYLIFVENNDGEFEAVIKGPIRINPIFSFAETRKQAGRTVSDWYNPTIFGSPYSNGITNWYGNHETSESDFLFHFNRLYLSKNDVNYGDRK